MGSFSDPTVQVDQSEDGRSVVVTYRFHELPYVTKVSVQGIGYFPQEEKAGKVITTKACSYLNEVILESDLQYNERVFAERGDQGAAKRCRPPSRTATSRSPSWSSSARR